MRGMPYLLGGAALKERFRFASEVVKSVQSAVGPDDPVILRFSQWKQQDFTFRLTDSPQAMAGWLVPLVAAGVDAFHCSQRCFWEPVFPEIDGEAGLNFAGRAKKLTGAATISVGSVGLTGDFVNAFGGESSEPASLQNLVNRLERDEFDLIAVGRALLSDLLWVKKVRAGDSGALKGITPAALTELV